MHQLFGLLVPLVCGLLCVAAEPDPQHTYVVPNGPYVFGPLGNLVYIRGQNEGEYEVPGVPGQFQNSLAAKQHVFTDEQGNTYVNSKRARQLAKRRRPRSPQFPVERPGRTVNVGSEGYSVQRHSSGPQFHVERPGRIVDYDNGGFVVQKSRRSINDARVQGENFVARDDQAGVWNDDVSEWKRPDGRTVSVDSEGRVHVSGYGHDQVW